MGPPDTRAYHGHVYTSVDEGAHWTDVTPPLTCAVPHALVYLSDRAGHLLLGTYSGDVTCPSINGQVLESFDNGAHWRDATTNLSPSHVWLGGLIEDPTEAGTLFVSTWYEGYFVLRR